METEDVSDAPLQLKTRPRSVASYVQEIRLYEKAADKWLKRSRKIVRRYKDERPTTGQNDTSPSRFNILWSMVQTQRPALYAKPPKPDIARRFKDADPVGRVAADVLERCTAYTVNAQTHRAIGQAVLDYLLPGRGILWVRYEPHFRDVAVKAPNADEGPETTDSADTDDYESSEELDYEEVEDDYVNWPDFGHNVARTWEEVWGVWRRVYMDRDALKKRFPGLGAKVPLTRGTKTDDDKIDELNGKAEIYEFWDSRDRAVKWFHRDMDEFLDDLPDPLQLEDFFPCPCPLLANAANDSLIPVPDYVQYQDQAVELDDLTARITSLTESVKVAGIYDASAEAISKLLTSGVENKLIPVESWAAFGDKGFAGLMAFLPLKEIVEALIALYEAREKVEQVIYGITGMSDIIRGQSDPDETMGAQKIKSNFATMRLSERQAEVQRFARDIVSINAQIIAQHFSLDTIKQISGVRLFMAAEKKAIQAGTPPPPGIDQDTLETMMTDPTWEEVMALLKNHCMRSFRIDIETDSTIKADQEAEKAARIEFLKAAGGFLQQATETGQQVPAMVPLLSQMLMFGVRAFPVGKELESTFATTFAKLEKAAANPQPRPDPAMAKVQADAQAKQMQAQMDQQAQAAKLASEEKLAQMKMQMEAATDQHRNELEAARDQARIQADMHLAHVKMQNESALAQQKMEFEARTQETIAHIKAASAIEVARITSKAAISDGVTAEAREQAAEDLGSVVKPSMAAISEHIQAMANSVKSAQPMQQDNTALHQHIGNLTSAVAQLADSHAKTMDALTSEKEIVRGPDGKATGVRAKMRARDLAAGIQ